MDIGRKNWMHSYSLEGARTFGIILSICKIAELDGLDSVKCLTILFDRVPNLDASSDEALGQLLS